MNKHRPNKTDRTRIRRSTRAAMKKNKGKCAQSTRAAMTYVSLALTAKG